ncbi:MAG: phosphopantothenoylcysteine decarboxylase [Planctomycetes bacterium RBG_16_43_13]|nr:MAG: phosphopantothenoylcysteine decarboxylase [Planctomycetes bacterium RBG_16_43_13]
MKGKNVILGVTGSIAAYKAADIASALVQKGINVTVIMTASATKFITPFTLQTLTRNRVLCDQFDIDSVIDPSHISLTDKNDLVLIAPATANFIGKVANGIADDALTSLMLAVKCPVLVAPAMNDRMYQNKAVQENMKKLKQFGYKFIDPEKGYLACGSYGDGRLANLGRIISAVQRELK